MSAAPSGPCVAATPWRAEGSVLRDANGNSIASAGNNRRVTGNELHLSLRLAALAPALLAALRRANDLAPGCLPPEADALLAQTRDFVLPDASA